MQNITSKISQTALLIDIRALSVGVGGVGVDHARNDVVFVPAHRRVQARYVPMPSFVVSTPSRNHCTGF